MKYTAYNYNMGRVVASAKFEAHSDAQAAQIAEQKLPGKNGQGQGGTKARIIGIKRES